MYSFDCVIFDFDGTVTDTGEGIIKSLQYAFEKLGDPVPSPKELRRFIGPPLFYSFSHFYGIEQERVQEYIDKYRERYTVKGIYECELYQGVAELIRRLREKGIRIGIASSKPEKLIYDVAEYLGVLGLFDCICGVRLDDNSHSSKTGLILRGMECLGITDAGKVLMVGDRCFDIDGAKGAGVKSCGVLWGYGSRQELEEHQADCIAQKPEDILSFVENKEV